MFRKSGISLIVTSLAIILAALAFPSFVFAGGWAVITLDDLPGPVITGQPYAVGMMARQHGKTPWLVEELKVETTHAESGQKVLFSAKPEGEPGHYQVELLFPRGGRWDWGVSSGLYPDMQPMPALEVASGEGSTASTSKGLTTWVDRINSVPAAMMGLLALLTFAGGVTMIVRSRKKQPMRIAGIGMLVLCGGLAFAFISTTNAEARKNLPTSLIEAGAPDGQKLFLAEGCVVCHVNDRAIERSASYGVEFGPNLTEYHNAPGYLKEFLAGPQAEKPGIEMPDLGLEPAEIDALVEFINGSGED